jgi:hypothetical protein
MFKKRQLILVCNPIHADMVLEIIQGEFYKTELGGPLPRFQIGVITLENYPEDIFAICHRDGVVEETIKPLTDNALIELVSKNKGFI